MIGSELASAALSITLTVESCDTQASLHPDGEKATPWTQPTEEYSTIGCPKGILEPHGLGAGFSSIWNI